jgi:hypothetical protein
MSFKIEDKDGKVREYPTFQQALNAMKPGDTYREPKR